MPNESPFTRESAARTDPVVGSASTLLCGAGIDASAAGAFAIGATNATTITIGRAGQSVVFPGTTTVGSLSTTVDIADRIIHLGLTTGNAAVPTLPIGISADRGASGGVDRDMSSLVWDEADAVSSRWKFCLITQGDDTTLSTYQTVQALRFDAPTLGRADAGVLALGGAATSIVSTVSIAGLALYAPTIGRSDAGALAFGGSATSIVAGAPITFAATQLGTIQTRTVTIGHADLTDADGEQTLNIGAVLPANAMILAVNVALATPFTGGGAGSVLLDIGTAGDPDAIVANCDLFAAAVDGVASSMPAGIAPFKLFTSAGAQLLATVAADVNVADLAAGAAVITVSFVVVA
jgi:hypothetical protein